MLSENDPKYARTANAPVLIIGLLFIVVILLMTCVLAVLLLNQPKEPLPTEQQDVLAILIPTASLSTAMPANHFSISLPIIQSIPVSVPEQIWKVTKIKSLGYKMSGKRYDLATFTRIDGQDTVQGYCINRGWDIPDIGTEYLLKPGGTFVPLQESKTHPFQRFLMIQ